MTKIIGVVRENLQVVVVFFFLVFMFLMSTSCNKSDEAPLNGQVRIMLTDAPYPLTLVENAYVTLEKIELRRNGLSDQNGDNNGDEMNDDPGEGSPFIVVMDEPKQFNLMNLQNGITEELAMVEVPAGNYDLVRMYMQGETIEMKDGTVHDFKIPSGGSSGLKIFIQPGLMVEGGLTAELLLDVNLNRSLVMKGNPDNIQGFNFSPVVRAMNVSTTGRVEGIVTDDSQIALEGVNVSLLDAESNEIVNAVTDVDGFYALIGVPEGTYQLVAIKTDYEDFTVDNVVVKSGNKTELDVEMTESAPAD